MNKKVDEEFKNIHDEYLLQCICTELKEEIENLKLNLRVLQADFLNIIHLLNLEEDCSYFDILDRITILKRECNKND